MWKKFKESKFARKCKELSHRGGVVAAVVCLALILTVALSVSVATNRAKKKFAAENVTNSESAVEEVTESNGDGTENGTVNAPTHKEENETPVDGEPEEFELSLPVSGTIAKGHDATIQVWSDTLGAYKVHLGLDITGDKGAPVLAAAEGTIVKVWDDALMGKCVAIDHGDDIFTFYKNLDPVLSEGIKEGKEIGRGEQLGVIGESAISELADESHLHIEMTVGGISVDPADYFSQEAKDTISGVNGGDQEVAADK